MFSLSIQNKGLSVKLKKSIFVKMDIGHIQLIQTYAELLEEIHVRLMGHKQLLKAVKIMYLTMDKTVIMLG